MNRIRLPLAVVLTAVVVAAAAALALPIRPGPPLHFRPAIYIDNQLAGSEGFVIEHAKSHRLIYATHEGTTLLYRSGLLASPVGDADFLTTYRNQVNLWTSADTGKSWQRANLAGTGFFTTPTINSGFSDPDLTQDAGGTIYGAGIDLVNDAVFSSPDGGKSWPTGNVQCHNGDRPWLAGGRPGEVFLSTDSSDLGHIVVRSTDNGASCSSSSASAAGTMQGGSWNGYGKIFYDPRSGALVEPAIFTGGGRTGLGLAVLPDAEHAFDSGTGLAFHASVAVPDTSVNTFWKAVAAVDRAGTTYVVWTTDARGRGSAGCNGTTSPVANDLMMVSTPDLGVTWSKPVVLVHTGRTLLWPWVVAGSGGNISVSWMSYDRVTDPDCAPAGATVRLYTRDVLGWKRTRTVMTPKLDVVGRPIHAGNICQQGTACNAGVGDRRLGEFFTTAMDHRGCVMFAAGDTMRTDPVTGGQLPTARGIFTMQSGGPSLTGGTCN